jgi:hypothetical protein
MGLLFSSNGPKIDEGLFRITLSVVPARVLGTFKPRDLNAGGLGTDGALGCGTGSVLVVTLRLERREAGRAFCSCCCAGAWCFELCDLSTRDSQGVNRDVVPYSPSCVKMIEYGEVCCESQARNE